MQGVTLALVRLNAYAVRPPVQVRGTQVIRTFSTSKYVFTRDVNLWVPREPPKKKAIAPATTDVVVGYLPYSP